jgi:serine protease Do
MDNMESKNENSQEQQNTPVDGEYSFFYGHKPENEQAEAQSDAPKTEPEMPKAEKKPFWKKPGAMIAGVLVAAMLAGFGGSAIGNAVFGGSSGGTTVYEGKRPTTVINTANIDTSKQMTAAEVYAANVNSTVGITTQVTTNYWGYTTQSAASGSGFIYSSDGYIITNYHVIESASSIKVTLYDGTSYDAQLIGYDESNDVAVLKIDAKDLTPVTIGDSSNLNVGDSVIAIGNPLGELTFSLTSGAVSALDREVTMSNNVTMELIQTDCAINSGNSGGALFNLYGEVIGITNAKYSGSSGSGASIDNIGFAIPINSVRSIVDSIIEKGYVAKPYIGVMVSDVSDEAISYGTPAGAAVASVTEGGPAEKAGLQANDIITAVDGKAISGKSDLSSIIADHAAGDKLTLSVYRQGQTLTVTVTIGEQTTSALANQQQSQQSQQQQQTMPDIFGFGG